MKTAQLTHRTRVGRVLTRTAAGDQDAFADLYRVMSPRVYRLAQQIIVDSALSQEIIEDLFLHVWQKAHTFEAPKGHLCRLVVAWLMIITTAGPWTGRGPNTHRRIATPPTPWQPTHRILTRQPKQQSTGSKNRRAPDPSKPSVPPNVKRSIWSPPTGSPTSKSAPTSAFHYQQPKPASAAGSSA